MTKPITVRTPLFATGTGRCGTHLLYELFSAHSLTDSHHILNPDADSFYRYCHWNQIDIDNNGFFAERNNLIKNAANNGKVYCESNPYLSFSIIELFKEFNAKFLFVIRNPEAVVRSHVVKGWYSSEMVYKDPQKPLGFQYQMQTNHFFGRIVPKGKELIRWSSLTRIGKISWMWKTVNESILEQFSSIPEKNKFTLRIEDLDYPKYCEICEFLEVDPIHKTKAEEIIESRPGKQKKDNEPWTELEILEFGNEIAGTCSSFGY